jgi:hypothetical protein
MTDNKQQLQDAPAANPPVELDEAELSQAAGGTTPSPGEIVITKHVDTSSAR